MKSSSNGFLEIQNFLKSRKFKSFNKENFQLKSPHLKALVMKKKNQIDFKNLPDSLTKEIDLTQKFLKKILDFKGAKLLELSTK